jgi:hypothetical protein
MKKKMLLLSAILSIVVTITTAFGFASKHELPNSLDPIWFTLDSGGTETDPEDYTAAPGYNPTTNGCIGNDEMCAVKTLPDGNGDPILDITSERVVTGTHVTQVARTEE